MRSRHSVRDTGPYKGCLIAMGTRHQKEGQVAPAFAALLDARVIVPPSLDTDQFGTFTGERPRLLPAIDAARAKASLAMRVAGTAHGLASEATYGPHSAAGCLLHEEILLFVDACRGLEIAEKAGEVSLPGQRHSVRGIAELPSELLEAKSSQAWIVRPAGSDDVAAISKGLTGRAALSHAVETALECSPDGLAIVEPDLRAMHNPARRAVIEGLAHRLALRMRTRCPRCGTVGYGRVGVERGLPCRVCKTESELPRADVYGCAACAHREYRSASSTADPRWCPFCNP